MQSVVLEKGLSTHIRRQHGYPVETQRGRRLFNDTMGVQDLVKHDSIVRDNCLQAQGEMGLKEFLRQGRECWHAYQLDLVTYQNKCQLIRGWDELFNKCREHLNSLAAMKLSPYFLVFEEEASAWEDKLNRVQALFDIWIDMQRRWVYLDGIFGGSADIEHLPPRETQIFQTISTEFLTLMRKVAEDSLIIEVLNIPQVQKLLERLADLLAKIQKALGEYLERERSSFPRFYFVGDEDLLEIIGNSKNVSKLQKHFKKMFAGISSILLSDDEVQILGIASKEGEEVTFATPISLKDHPKINDWLALIEQEMRNNLAQQLTVAVKDIKEFDGSEFNSEAYVKWVDLFQAQLIVLASQIFWSERVAASYQSTYSPIQSVLRSVEYTLNVLAACVLREQPPLRRRKLEHLIIESVHQRDVIRSLIHKNVSHPKDFHWLAHMRFYFDATQPEVLDKLSVHMAAASFHYGFEYLGVQDRLVQTPLTDL